MNEFRVLLATWSRLGLPHRPRLMRQVLADARSALAAEDGLRAALASADRTARYRRRERLRERSERDRVLSFRLDQAAVAAALCERLDRRVEAALRSDRDRRRRPVHRM